MRLPLTLPNINEAWATVFQLVRIWDKLNDRVYYWTCPLRCPCLGLEFLYHIGLFWVQRYESLPVLDLNKDEYFHLKINK